MNLLNGCSEKESARRMHKICFCHFDDTCPSALRSEYGDAGNDQTKELFKKQDDVCIVCGFVSADEFFSFPSNIDIRQQWATFCDIPIDKIKPNFRLCDRHFKTDDYRISIQRKLLIPASVPTLQPKLKHSFAPSIDDSLQSSVNSISFSNPTLNKNASKNVICGSVFKSNTTTDASNKQFRRNLVDITNNHDDVPSKAKKMTLKRKLKVERSSLQTKRFRSDIFRLRTRCSRLEDTVADLRKKIERLEERYFVLPAEIDRNISEDTRDRRQAIHSSEKLGESSCNAEASPEKDHEEETTDAAADVENNHHQSLTITLPENRSSVSCNTNTFTWVSEQHSVNVASSESAGNVTETTRDTNLPLFSLEKCNDSLSNAEAWREECSEKAALVESAGNVIIEGSHNMSLIVPPLENSNDNQYNAEETSGPYSVDETSKNVVEDGTYSTNFTIPPPHESHGNNEAQSNECYDEVALVESAETVAEDDYLSDSSMPPLELSSDDDLHTSDSEKQVEQFSEKRYNSYLVQVSLVDIVQNVSEDDHNSNSSIFVPEKSNSEEVTVFAPIDTSADTHITEDTSKADFTISSLQQPNNSFHGANARPAHFEEEARPKKSRNVIEDEDDRNPLTGPSPEKSNNSPCNTEAQPKQHFEEESHAEYDEDYQFSNLNVLSPQKSNGVGRCDVEAQSQQRTEEDTPSKDLQNCFFDPTKAGGGVFLNILDDDEVVSGISVSPQINHPLGRSDTAAGSNNEIDKAQVGQTLLTEHVQETTLQPYFNDEPNVSQLKHNGQSSSSPECSKLRENGGEGRITRSAKKRKLPSVTTTIPSSEGVPKKVQGVLMRDSPPYCCNICGKTFSYKSCWATHRQQHLNPISCPKCKRLFLTQSQLVLHQKTHSEKRPYKCRFCDARFKYNQNNLRHERVHIEGPRFECAVCGKKFLRKWCIVVHLRLHSGEKPFHCQRCDKRFTQKCNLIEHQRTHSRKRRYKCCVCNRKYKYLRNKKRHERLHVEGPCFECALCGKKYSEKRSLARHILSNGHIMKTTRFHAQPSKAHSKRASVRCGRSEKTQMPVSRRSDTTAGSNNEFDKAQAGQTLLTEHVQETTLRPYFNDELNVSQVKRNGQASRSPDCSKNREYGGEGRITRPSKTRKELPSVTTTIPSSENVPKKVQAVLLPDSPPYCCNICGKTFSYRCRLVSHLTSHGENRPYKCSFCEARFKHNQHKLHHERVHIEGPRFECAVCGKKFPYKCEIVLHFRLHSGEKPFHCRRCDKRFTQNCNLIEHQQKHSRKRRYKCCVCNRKYKYLRDKQRHERLHVEGPRFECALCGKKYRDKRSLARHILSNGH